MIFIIVLVWTLSAIFGESFLQMNIVGGMNFYYIFLGICLMYFIFHLFFKSRLFNWREYGGFEFGRSLIVFLLISVIYIVISFLNIPDMFNLNNLMYDSSYIFRHASFIPSFAILFSVYLCVLKSNYIENLKLYKLYLFLFGLFVVTKYVDIDIIVYSLLVILLGSLILIKKKSIFSVIFLLFIIFVEVVGMSSFLLANIVLISIFIFRKSIINFFSKNYKFKTLFIFTSVALLLIIVSNSLMGIISSDANSLWRLNVWMNEINNLKNTLGFGVGFGTAYVDNNIFYEVDNSNMYSTLSELFLVANHNSIINMFYRLGLMGGICFLIMNITLIAWFAKVYKNINNNEKKYLLWAFANFAYSLIIISFNPGLESPRFSYGFYISSGLLIGFIIKSQKKYVNN
ncbi:hypothetical protein LG296_06745 [Ureibacillus chungkukjangi]|uniref:hypothetical protein n=1 Tax=Ureibacillus chungkukjangi TaxID=1202712 RepID=UPI00384FF5A3